MPSNLEQIIAREAPGWSLINVDDYNRFKNYVPSPATAGMSILAAWNAADNASSATLQSINPDNPPLYCFSVNNDTGTSYTRNIVNSIYMDGLFNSNKKVTLNRAGYFPINPKVSGFVQLPFKSDTYNIPAQSVNNLVTNVSSVNTKIKLLGIGASLTALPLTNIDGTNAPYWGIVSRAIYNMLRDNIDRPALPTPVQVGHLNFFSRTFTYAGQTVTIRGGNAAIASWAGSHYLYHAIRLCAVNPGVPDNSAAGHVQPNISYYLQGLQTTTGAAYTGSITQQEQIRTTVFGKNPCDKNATLYDWMKVQVGWGGAVDTYTGSGTQNTNMDNFMEYLCDNPRNPFYSKSKARTVGSTNAFSLIEYLNKYKTLADDGITRLVVGSTAGTKVTDVNAYDVCTPTHITINFFENDLWLFPNAGIPTLCQTMRLIAETITGAFPTIKVAILNTPRPGTLFPELFSPGIRYPKSDPTLDKATIRAEYIKNLAIDQTKTKAGNVYYVDAYQYMYPLSHQYAFIGESAGDPIDFEEDALSTVHPGLKAAATVGDQIYGWAYWSLTN